MPACASGSLPSEPLQEGHRIWDLGQRPQGHLLYWSPTVWRDLPKRSRRNSLFPVSILGRALVKQYSLIPQMIMGCLHYATATIKTKTDPVYALIMVQR